LTGDFPYKRHIDLSNDHNLTHLPQSLNFNKIPTFHPRPTQRNTFNDFDNQRTITMAALTAEEQLTFLISCIRYNDNGKVGIAPPSPESCN
jgi:hypothetical protein